MQSKKNAAANSKVRDRIGREDQTPTPGFDPEALEEVEKDISDIKTEVEDLTKSVNEMKRTQKLSQDLFSGRSAT